MRLKIAAFVLLFAALVPLAVSLFRAGDCPGATWAWDPSSHARNGLRLTQGITKLDPIGLFRELLYPHHYPPVHSIVQVPFFLALGPGPAAPRIPTILAAFATAMLGLALAIRFGANPVAAAIFLAAAFWTSPHYLCMAAVPMLEVFGGLGLVLFAFCYARSLDHPGQSRWAALSFTLLFLTATNWFVMAAAALIVHVVLRHGWRTCRDRLREFIGDYRPHKGLPLAFNLAAVAVIGVAVWVQQTGGFQYGRLLLKSPLGPISVATYLIAAQGVAIFWRRRERIRAWPVAARAWLSWCAAPLFAWLFLTEPGRMRGTIGFMFGSASPLPMGERLLYYPQRWFIDFHLSIAVGILAAAGAIVLAARWRRLPEGARYLAVLLGVCCAALMAHRARELRFATGVLPLFWIAAAVIPANRWIALAAAVAVAGFSAAPAAALHRGPLAARVVQQYLHPGLQPAADFAADACAGARGSFRLISIYDGLTDHVIENEVRARRDFRELRYDTDFPAGTEELARAWFDKWKESKKAEDTVVMFLLSPEILREQSLFFAKAPHLQKLDGWLAGCPRYRLDREGDFSAKGVRIRVWKRVD